MDNLLKIIERAGNDLLQADEYLARVGVRAIPSRQSEPIRLSLRAGRCIWFDRR